MAAPFDKSEIIEFFLVEAGEHIQNLNAGLLSLEKDPVNRATIDELFRAAHTLKGSAAMMGFQGISDVAHKAEDMLGQFRSGSIPIVKNTLNFLFDTVDAVKLMVDGISAKNPEDPLLIEGIAQSYKDVMASLRSAPVAPAQKREEPRPAAPAPSPPKAAETPRPAGAIPKPQPSPEPKDDIDLAWEKTFEIEKEPIPVEPLEEEVGPQQEQPGPLNEPVAPPAQPEPPKQQATPAAEPLPAAQAAAPESDSLRHDIEEAKKAGLLEKRGLGRRAMDAPDVEKQFIRVNIERLDNLMNLVGEMVVNRNRLVKQVELIKALREEITFSQKRLLGVVKNFEEKYEYTLHYQSPSQLAVEQPHDFFELEFDRYDDFNLLSRKLTEISNDTNEIMTEFAGFFDSFELDASRISMITTNLQDEITMARMVEMDKLFQLFQRPVRDLTQSENKQVNMVVTGAETKIDKTIFEIISDPLMHMIRNAISHGIETAEERTKIGKDPTGSLILNARHEGNNIVLEVQDDGRGMDPVVLRKAAVDKGFLSSTEAQTLSDADAINLIFKPGFSTAAAVGKVSGRGVGMDVVSNQLAKINGRIEIKTEPRVGTKFVIRLPLTLAIAQALIVKFKDQELAIPMSIVEETTRFSYKDIQRVAGEEMVNLRDTLIRLIKLNDLLGVGKFPKKDESYRYPTLILGTAEKRLALMVEDIAGREEIVVKSLGEYLKSIKMFSGATISGEGNVRLIINLAAVLGDEVLGAKASFIPAHEAVAARTTTAEAVVKRKPRVLVVDDSISIRKFVQRFLDRVGYEVEVAADGMAALGVMGKAKFDVVITDLEMPVMHGYDLIAEMKRTPALANIPIIVLTSRAGEKHRQKALEMGAQDYLVKPFEEQEMVSVLKKVLSGAALASRA
jgi:chemotaxis protein histidine kinase CheA/ActR/RegA family two-component response regulator